MSGLVEQHQEEITDFRRWTIGGLSSIVFVGATSWAGWTTITLIDMRNMLGDRPTHAEMKAEIDNYSPYRRDEPMIKRQLLEIDKRLESVDVKLDKLRDYLIENK